MCSGISRGLPTSLAQHGIPIQMRLSSAFYRPLRPLFEFMVHQGRPTISNLVLSPPMNQRLVSATIAVEPELNLHEKLPPLVLVVVKNKTGQWKSP